MSTVVLATGVVKARLCGRLGRAGVSVVGGRRVESINQLVDSGLADGIISMVKGIGDSGHQSLMCG